ncbi:hypothetical protein [Lachnospira multipara]|uniref:hypothetical protein n=1 Tax=Lachnospira multipara TaxID=28051 RepID=UPI00047F55CB|nr:hypothetical protein [Lachnospira multipara]
MKIEIAEPGRMAQSGSSLLKLIQNNNMPVLDLLVRESIQNSLDAKNDKDDYVSVDFLTGYFEKERLNNELEGITDSLNNRYRDNRYRYIAISDYHTVGLTGKLHEDEVLDNKYGNLLKLIYQISKPQEAEGAGGSWGLGKTVYFRVGIGLVLYYSRILNEDGNYESRFVASLVEDEMSKDALIPVLNGKSKRGIAWWGKEIGQNKTQPITDEMEANRLLSIFGIEPYSGDKTGTVIIIPYVDEYNLLNNNQIEYKDGENTIQPYWRSNVEEYLKVAVQRWYAPRLNNINYQYGKYLRVKINNEGIGLDNMEPTFQIVQALYNRALGNKYPKDILDNDGVETKVEDINLRNVLVSQKAGAIAFTKVPRKVLKACYPDNKPEPYMYFNCEIREKETNKPVVFFTRKPGMIVSYEDVGTWVDGISSSNKDEFIMAMFVLNSDNNLYDEKVNYKLEEYVRKSEMADHTSWGDFSIGNFNPRIVSKVQKQIKSKISKEFMDEEEENSSRLNSGFGKLFGDLLLPPENFGRKPSASPKKTKKDDVISKHKNVVLKYGEKGIEYCPDGIIITLNLESRSKVNSTGFELAIESESGAISYTEWENKMNLLMPFDVVDTDITGTVRNDSQLKINTILTELNDNETTDFVDVKLKKTEKGSIVGVHFDFKKESNFDLQVKVKLKLSRKDLKPVFKLEKDGEL